MLFPFRKPQRQAHEHSAPAALPAVLLACSESVAASSFADAHRPQSLVQVYGGAAAVRDLDVRASMELAVAEGARHVLLTGHAGCTAVRRPGRPADDAAAFDALLSAVEAVTRGSFAELVRERELRVHALWFDDETGAIYRLVGGKLQLFDGVGLGRFLRDLRLTLLP